MILFLKFDIALFPPNFLRKTINSINDWFVLLSIYGKVSQEFRTNRRFKEEQNLHDKSRPWCRRRTQRCTGTGGPMNKDEFPFYSTPGISISTGAWSRSSTRNKATSQVHRDILRSSCSNTWVFFTNFFVFLLFNLLCTKLNETVLKVP